MFSALPFKYWAFSWQNRTLHTFYFSITANVLKVKFLSAYLDQDGLTDKKKNTVALG